MLGGFRLWNLGLQRADVLMGTTVKTESQGCVSTWLCAVQCLCALCGVCQPLLPESAFPQGLGHDSAPGSSIQSAPVYA